MHISVRGLVVKREVCLNDSSLLTILTEKDGLIKAYCKPYSSKRSAYITPAAVEVLSYTEFNLYKSRTAYTVDGADSEMIFSLVRTDIDRLAIAQYLCDIVSAIGTQGYGDDTYLKFMVNSLYILNKKEYDPYIIKPIGELKLMCIAGYMPNMMTCHNCGNFEINSAFFNYVDGVIYCDKCFVMDDSPTYRVNLSVLNALRHITVTQGSKLYSFHLPQKDIETLNIVTELYVKARVERKFNSLSYIHRLQNLNKKNDELEKLNNQNN